MGAAAAVYILMAVKCLGIDLIQNKAVPEQGDTYSNTTYVY